MNTEPIRVLLEASLRGALVLGLAAAASLALRRRSAALRHALWWTALASLPLLPLATTFLPPIALPILPYREITRVSTSPRSAAMADAGVEAREAAGSEPSFGASTPPPPSRPAVPWTALWLAGAAWMMVRTIRSHRRVAALGAGAEPALDARLAHHWRRALESSGAPVATECRVSALVQVPLACDLLRSRVLLPPEASEWSDAHLRAVLTHELAHVRRRDPLGLAVAHAVRAIYWFHPLVWWAVRELRAESERACDDAVIRAGERPSSYADTLLPFAGVAAPEPAAALAFLRRGSLEGRITGILEKHRDRAALRRIERRWIAGVWLASVLALGLLQPVASKASRDTAPRARASEVPERVSESWYSRARSIEPTAVRFRNRFECPVRIRYAMARIVPRVGRDATGVTMPELTLENRDPARRVVALLLAMDLPSTRDRSWIDVSIAPASIGEVRLPAREWSAVIPEGEADELVVHVVGVRFADGRIWEAREPRRVSVAPRPPEESIAPEPGVAPEAETAPEAVEPVTPSWEPNVNWPREQPKTPEAEPAPKVRHWPESGWVPKPESSPWSHWTPAEQGNPWPDPRPNPRPDPRPDARPDVRPDPRPDADDRHEAIGWIPARIRNPVDAPVVIVEARTAPHAPTLDGGRPLTWLPEVVIENRSDRRIIGLRLRYKAEPEGHAVSGYTLSIEPHGTAIVHRENFEIWGTPEAMTVQLLGVRFADNRVWGTLDSRIDARDPWVYPLTPEER